MASDVVLVTGVADHLGGPPAARPAADPAIERVLGVDPAPPAAGPPTRVEFVCADTRGSRAAKVLVSARADTVVHLARARAPRPSAGHVTTGERDVSGTMGLLAGGRRAGDIADTVRDTIQSTPNSLVAARSSVF